MAQAKRHRVIVCTDAKNEADDQFAIVHALLTPLFDVRGIVPSHFGERVRGGKPSLQASHDEVLLLLQLMGLLGKVRVEDGAPHAMPNENTPVESPGAHLILSEALSQPEEPLYIAVYGPLTDVASALLIEPRLAQCKVRVVWIGGGEWPAGGWEFNLANDVHAANAVFKSSVELWQIPQPVYRMMAVSHAELMEKVYPQGEIGRYLVEQLLEFNATMVDEPIEHRCLGDSPAVGVIMYPDCGRWEWRPAPQFDPLMHYVHTGTHRPIRVYTSIDSRFILEDFYAKLAQFVRDRAASR